MSQMFIRRIGTWSVFKFSAVLYLILFLISFLFLLVAYLVAMGSGFMGSQGKEAAEVMKVLGLSGGVALVALFFAGLFFSIVYAVFNSIGALVYNLISWMTGGLEISLEEKEE